VLHPNATKRGATSPRTVIAEHLSRHYLQRPPTACAPWDRLRGYATPGVESAVVTHPVLDRRSVACTRSRHAPARFAAKLLSVETPRARLQAADAGRFSPGGEAGRRGPTRSSVLPTRRRRHPLGRRSGSSAPVRNAFARPTPRGRGRAARRRPRARRREARRTQGRNPPPGRRGTNARVGSRLARDGETLDLLQGWRVKRDVR
jgi:hypothetical protein